MGSYNAVFASLGIAASLVGFSVTEAPPVAAGPHRRAAPSGPCPSEMAFVSGAYCVDRFEASTVELGDDGSILPHSPYLPVTGVRVRAVSKQGVIPQGYINRNEAEGACREAGKRLCTDEEWIGACRGSNQSLYPYGNQRRDGYCVDTARVAPLPKVFGALGINFYQYAPMNDPRLNQIEGTVAPTGSFEKCTNELGVYDMVGNLHEWTANEHGTFRGGYYLDTRINGEGCSYRTIAHAGTYHDYSTGFRCCADPTPVSR